MIAARGMFENAEVDHRLFHADASETEEVSTSQWRLTDEATDEFNHIVTMYLDHPEARAMKRKTITMEGWDDLLTVPLDTTGVDMT